MGRYVQPRNMHGLNCKFGRILSVVFLEDFSAFPTRMRGANPATKCAMKVA